MNIENSKDLLISEDDLNNLELKIPWYYSLGIITFLFLLYPFTFFISGVLALICLFGRKKIIKKHNEKIKLYSDRILEFNKHYSELAEEVYKKELSLKDLNVEMINKIKEIKDFENNNIDRLKIMEETIKVKKELDNFKFRKQNILDEIDKLKEKYNNTLKKEEDNLEKIKQKVDKIKEEEESLKDIDQAIKNKELEFQNITTEIETNIAKKKVELDELTKELIETDDKILLQSFGLYEPKYDFENSEEYMTKLKAIRDNQKILVREKTGVDYYDGWTVDGSLQKGKTMTNQNIKTIFKLFNSECDNAINKLSFKNITTTEKRIRKAFNDANKLNTTNRVSLKESYLNLKIDELYLYFEYLQKKEDEKEEQRALREQMREEAQAKKEIDALKSKLKKEEIHFLNELNRLKSNMPNDEDEKLIWNDKIKEIENRLAILEEDIKDVMNREQNTRAGYVYIISNIGSFGENIYKIGVTRRLDPTERVNELGSASVPFKYDIHATIFSEDAPTLENALHKAFNDERVNKVNSRKEFFNVSLEEIKHEVERNHNKTVEYTKLAEAMEYRQTLKLKEKEKLEKAIV